MAERKLRPVTGRKRVTMKPNVQFAHSDGWNGAMDNALKKIGWPPDTYKNVDISFTATVKVVNPGSIIEYAVKLTPTG
jgi:hypothetical protein